MHYNYLNQWMLENHTTDLLFKDFEKYEDQYLITFKNDKTALQICFSSFDQFIFFNREYDQYPFERTGDLTIMSAHLNHSKMSDMVLNETDRIICLHFEKYNIYNTLEKLVLIIEIIPKYNNLILCRLKDDQLIILDSLKKFSFADNQSRQILPGVEYKKPETSYLTTNIPLNYPLFIKNMKIHTEANEGEVFHDINSLFTSLYYEQILNHRLISIKNQKIQQIKKMITKKNDKLQKLNEELQTEENAFEFKKKGELLLAFFNQVPENEEFVILNDYYQEDNPPLKITLNSRLSPKQNIAQYFKKYKKAQSGRVKIEEQIRICQNEILEYETKIERIESINSYTDIKNEDIKTETKENIKTLFRILKINDEWEINIGRSNTENDILTCKTAKPDDWWFHTRIFRGTHVVLRNYKKQTPPEKLIILCSRLAAWYSKAKTSGNVPVDYTLIRYVRKPRGSAKGFVTYTKQKTIYVDPLSIRVAAEMLNKGEF